MAIMDIKTLSGVSDENDLGMYCHKPKIINNTPINIMKYEIRLVML